MKLRKPLRHQGQTKPGQMNKTEEAYAAFLKGKQLMGAIDSYAYEAVKLKLADRTFYTPDFMVDAITHIEFHEVKGYWQDDARVKIKVAASLYPQFKFIAIKKGNKTTPWIVEEF